MLLYGLCGTLSDYYQADVHSAKHQAKKRLPGRFFDVRPPGRTVSGKNVGESGLRGAGYHSA
jgi:hypothetical protein